MGLRVRSARSRVWAMDVDPARVSDRWLSWLKVGRDAGNVEARRRALAWLQPVFERVLGGAQLRAGDTVLEVGAGEGMLGLMALDVIGVSGRLVLSDISPAVIAGLSDSLVEDVLPRVERVTAPVETLAGIADASVDVVLSRSVLIYSSDLPAAMTAIARVLRPGGRISAFEPLWEFFDESASPGGFFGRDLAGLESEVAAVAAGYRVDLQAMLDCPLTAESMLAAAEAAGLASIKATIEAESVPMPIGDDIVVDQVLNGRPNPNTVSPAEMAARVLSAEQAEHFLAGLRQSVLTGRGRSRTAAVYFQASR